MYYAFQVLGWVNEQTVQAPSKAEGWNKALKIAKEEDIRNFREISPRERAEILQSWDR